MTPLYMLFWGIDMRDDCRMDGLGRYLPFVACGWAAAWLGSMWFARHAYSLGYGKASFILCAVILLLEPVYFLLSWYVEQTWLDPLDAAERQREKKEKEEAEIRWREALRQFNEYIRSVQEAEAQAAKRKAIEQAREEARLAKVRAEEERANRDKVYFIVNRELNMVKIGVSNAPEKRVRSLQTSNPHQLELVATLPGGYSMESQLHERYAQYRLKGEWFKLSPVISKQIEAAKFNAGGAH